MDREHKLGEFTFHINENRLKINDALEISLGETTKVLNLVDFAAKMQGLPVLPPSIEDPPFILEFNEDGSFLLSKPDSTGIKAELGQIDELVVGIQQSLQILGDAIKILGKHRFPAHVNLRANNSDIFEGKV